MATRGRRLPAVVAVSEAMRSTLLVQQARIDEATLRVQTLETAYQETIDTAARLLGLTSDDYDYDADRVAFVRKSKAA